MPHDSELKKDTVKEEHHAKYTVHLGSTKIYQNLKRHYGWINMKMEIAEYVSKCLVC